MRSAITSGKSGVGDIIIFATHSKKKENVEVGGAEKIPTLFLPYLVVVAIKKEVKVIRDVFTSRLIRRNGGKV